MAISGDVWVIFISRAIRTFCFGGIAVVLSLYLIDHGFTPWALGALFSATLFEDAIVTAIVSTMANKIGMVRILLASSLIVTTCGLILAWSTQWWLIALACVFGIVSPSGFEGGPFSAIEQVVIARAVPANALTKLLSWYNLLAFAGSAAGALCAGWTVSAFHGAHLFAYQVLFLAYAAGGVCTAFLYARLKTRQLPMQQATGDDEQQRAKGLKRAGSYSSWSNLSWSSLSWSNLSWKRLSRTEKPIIRFAYLQALDAFGGGFVAPVLISYWFYARYHVDAPFIGAVFFWTNILAALSFTLAPFICQRFGLVRTMVFTHLPCSLALCAVPFMPEAGSAAALLLARSVFSSMDIPVRQAYAMLLVPAEERASAAGITTASRSIAQGAAPVFSGAIMNLMANSIFLGLPFFLAGVFKSVYDLSLYAGFKNISLDQEQFAAEETNPALCKAGVSSGIGL